LGLECGAAQLLNRYERWRSVDNLAVSMATDGINHIYAIQGKAAKSIRRMGMGMIQKSGGIKAYLSRRDRRNAQDALRNRALKLVL
jgi:2-octaprenyl-6-methoxyphenol hydroxylase